MSGSPRSWKELRDQRRKEIFVGRTDYLRIFTDNYLGDEPQYMVFAVTGEGGVGKSTLLAQFRTIAKTPNIDLNVIICDERQGSPIEVMGYVAQELGKLDIKSKEFDEQYKQYRQLRHQIESDPKAPKGVLNLLTLGVTDLTIKTLRSAPGVGVFFEQADPKAVSEALTEMVNYGISRWGDNDEVQLLREPERVLTPVFIELLNKACDAQRTIIMFDVFERTGETLTPWLLGLFDFEYGSFNSGLTFCINQWC